MARSNLFGIRRWPETSFTHPGFNSQIGLNPFEIRGGLKLSADEKAWLEEGLNPFEIRGGLKPSNDKAREIARVLIPLKSGVA